MDWLNIRVSTLRAPEYIGSTPTERATWINVLCYSVERENGGRLVGAASWKDRQWQQTCGVTLREVRSATKLIELDGDDLIVWNYPIEKEDLVRSNRVNGANGGVSKTQAKTQAAKANGSLGGRPKNPSENPSEASVKNPSEASVKNPSENPTEEERNRNRNRNRNGMEVPPKPPIGASASPPLGVGDVLPTSPEAIEVSKLFGRKLDTKWSAKEIEKFKDCRRRNVLTLAAMGLIAAYYLSERAKGQDGRHRRDLATFLNNFDGELDRASTYANDPNANRTKNHRTESDRDRDRTGIISTAGQGLKVL